MARVLAMYHNLAQWLVYFFVEQPGSMAGVLALCHNLAQWLVH